MTAYVVPPVPAKTTFLDAGGNISRGWLTWLQAVYNRLGGAVDKVDAAYVLATNALPSTTQVTAAGGLRAIGVLGAGSVGIVMYRKSTTVSLLPTSGNATGDWSYATNGRKPGEAAAAGTGVPVFWSAGNWYAVTSGAIVTA